ncbi:peptidoglycan DD-metalloendopeptidase family protein [Streptomyces sp. ITFR-16]|uniref:peptidoglycan DD-metalloendopeptidase family protein n=1 Tax=Streptomyces sp. ITFR-16 TaxID=3075198 RepID=UPI002889BD3B|nr:peptidoglycan DD-metalloendopeptidase family protein [Streptomyces sp. ITFR-16]WNI22934.1 peptidoglycan DD-metalloendopeptidase family protein [Streptomyces sp. ITFR-16]
MNDQHPHAGYAGYDGHSTTAFDSDPLFGSLPGSYDGSYDTSADYGYGTSYATGQATYTGAYDTTQWDTGTHGTVGYDHTAGYQTYAEQPQQHPEYDAAAPYDTSATWLTADGYGPAVPAQGGAPESSGQWDTTAWYPNGQWAGTDTAAYDTGAYDATAWNTGATPGYEQQTVQTVPDPNEAEHAAQQTLGHYETTEPHEHAAPEAHDSYGQYNQYDPYEPYRTAESALPETDGEDPAPEPVDPHPAPHPVARPVTRSGGSRSRRRSPAKRSALLTVAVPSACVMSVAGIAAASVSGMGGGEEKKDDTTSMAAADPGTVKPVAANNKLDTQLANLSADAENFADRASRTQERIDLKERQAAEKKKRIEEAARKEALRPKYVMPVKQHGLSAYFGQAGVNWMSVHTGIDFPVQYGTPVMAATDGTVRTQYNTAYGNMAIVTMADGTETWYCHLSSTRIRSGPVKAGDVIAYSGNSGNSTGPHMHFEVRPGGGAAIDPLPWLRSHGVDPT